MVVLNSCGPGTPWELQKTKKWWHVDDVLIVFTLRGVAPLHLTHSLFKLLFVNGLWRWIHLNSISKF